MGRRTNSSSWPGCSGRPPLARRTLGGPCNLVPAQMTTDVTRILRDAYDRRVEERATRSAPAWETAERDIFLEFLRREGVTTLLELGAATGSDAAFFKAHGFEVACIDLSPRMVERCRARDLVAHVMDVADLRFPPDSFGAVYAMNCLVHVPRAELRGVLEGISPVVEPGGLFYLGLYGGREFEGVSDDDDFEPKRFFCHYPDEDLRVHVGSSSVWSLFGASRMVGTGYTSSR
jgi:SAM-dependent methyltransferase